MASVNGIQFCDCGHAHRAPEKLISKLPKTQAGPGRHRCPVCAYATGYKEGFAAAQRILAEIMGERNAALQKFLDCEIDPKSSLELEP